MNNQVTMVFCHMYGEQAYEDIWRACSGEDVPHVTVASQTGGNAMQMDQISRGFIELPEKVVYFHHFSGPGDGDGLSAFGNDPTKLPGWDD